MDGKLIVNLSKMPKEEREKAKEERKKRILALFVQGLSVKEVCSGIRIAPKTLVAWRKEDQMFGHHCIKAVG